MKPVYAALGCLGLTVALSAPAFAQQPTTTTTSGMTTGTTAPASANSDTSGPSGSLEKYHDKWRASKLVGSNVYNEKGVTIGTIDDVLIGDDGKISDAVLSVGGFLGLGGKYVSVPFDQFKFVESKQSTMTPAPATSTAAGSSTSASKMATASPVSYSIVLPNATKQSLTSAASFKYSG